MKNLKRKIVIKIGNEFETIKVNNNLVYGVLILSNLNNLEDC